MGKLANFNKNEKHTGKIWAAGDVQVFFSWIFSQKKLEDDQKRKDDDPWKVGAIGISKFPRVKIDILPTGPSVPVAVLAEKGTCWMESWILIFMFIPVFV